MDYYLHKPFTMDIQKIYAVHVTRDLPNVYIILHAYELLFIFWMAIFICSLDRHWVAAGIGLTQHFILDIASNPLTTPGYFLTYRIIKRFRSDLILKRKA